MKNYIIIIAFTIFSLSSKAQENVKWLSFEEAIVYVAARLNQDPNNDVNLNVRSWRRIGGNNVDVVQEKIRFVGQ